jgi:hypothetical protein
LIFHKDHFSLFLDFFQDFFTLIFDLQSSHFWCKAPYAISAYAASAGILAERVSDSETGESPSLLARESDSEAPAWLAKRSPASTSLSVSIGVISG